MGRAEELFQRIRAGKTAEIQRMISQPVTEELFLDYKKAATTKSSSKLDTSDRKNLAKAISGFGNSDGGIIVWGVACQSSTGDIPTDAPVDDPVGFKILLDGAVGGVTLPAHGGVENVALSLSNGTGYVVTHLPPGLNVPYRTIVKNEKDAYYIRAGSSFEPTPHAVLAGLFGRAPHSILEIEFDYLYHAPIGGVPRVQLTFKLALRNSGRGFAKGLFVSIDTEAPANCQARYVADERWQYWTSKTERGDRLTAVATPDFPTIPPGSEADALQYILELPKNVAGDIIVNITCGAETGPGSSYAATLPIGVLNQAAEIFTHSYTNEPERVAGERKARFIIEASLHPERLRGLSADV
jgi:hypothetical protein